MTIQVYVAEDQIDGVKSYFVFDTCYPGRYICGTYSIAIMCFGDNEGIVKSIKEEIKINGWDDFNDEGRRETMNDPVLIAEW